MNPPILDALAGHLARAGTAYHAGQAGPFPEFYCRPDTNGPRPGVMITSGPTDYSAESLAQLHWSCQEYADFRRGEMLHSRSTSGLLWADVLTTIRAWGYDPDARYWDAG